MKNNKIFIVVVAVVIIAGLIFVMKSKQPEAPVTQKQDVPDYSGITIPRVVKLMGRVGKGKVEAKSGSKVKIKYGSWVYDPKKPQNKGVAITPSPETTETIEIGSGNAIKGFEEGLMGVRGGDTRTLIIPPESAYGQKGLPPNVHPGAIVLIEVEILEVI